MKIQILMKNQKITTQAITLQVFQEDEFLFCSIFMQ